jgi:dTDP-4-dehydrorhamnose 3,5-epimerase
MKTEQTPLADLLIIHPDVYGDERGYFYESWNREKYAHLGIDADWIQDNQSMSQKNVLRGLHFQAPPHAQGKLVRVVRGSVMDVALDIRTDSPTFGQFFALELNEQNHTQLWIPPGFAHGFVTLEDHTIFSYKCSGGSYNQASEGCILWNDTDLNIDWGVHDPIISEKDKNGLRFADFNSPF